MDLSGNSLTWLMWATKSATIGAYVVQWLEFFDNISDEIIYLWRAPLKFITYLYAWSRYYPLCIQLVNLFLSYLSRTSNKPKFCFIAFCLKFITAQLMTTCVEIILMVRVHALYNCSRRVGIVLVVVWLIGTSLEALGSTMIILDLKAGPTGSICIPKRCSTDYMLLFIAGCGLIQTVLLTMTLTKIALHRKLGWLRTPVVTLMLRDGVGTFLMLAVTVIFITSFEAARENSILSTNIDLVWNVEFAWFISFMSITGCRLILNMRKLAVDAKRPRRWSWDSESDNTTQFSSVFDGDQYFSAEDVCSYSNVELRGERS